MKTKKPEKLAKTAQQRGKAARRKGQTYERDIAESLRALWPEAKRGIGQARVGGEVPDVAGTPWWIEAKHYKSSPNVLKAIQQAQKALDEHRSKHAVEHAYRKDAPTPFPAGILVIAKKTNESPEIAAMPLPTLMELIQTSRRLDALLRAAIAGEDSAAALIEEYRQLVSVSSWLTG